MYCTYDVFDDALKLRDLVNSCFRNAHSVKEVPLFNLYENGDQLTIKALMPGVKAEDLNIELADRVLKIEGEKKSDCADKHYLRTERNFGTFRKAISLPFDVDREKISATLADGVFTVTMEKSEASRSRKIEIK